MDPEIWSTTDRIFCHSGPSFALLPLMDPENQNFKNMKKHPPGGIIISHKCTRNDNHTIYSCRDMKRDWECFVILDHFLPFCPPNNPKNQNVQKKKYMPGDFTSFYLSVP